MTIVTDSVVAKIWDVLVEGGWTPPTKPSDAVTLVMGMMAESPVVIEETKRVGAIETRTRIYGDTGWPPGFAWLKEPVLVKGESFRYFGTALCSFPKLDGKVRYVVEDQGRLFVQRGEQLDFIPKSEPPPHGPILDDMDNELAGRPTGCPKCGFRHPPDGMCV